MLKKRKVMSIILATIIASMSLFSANAIVASENTFTDNNYYLSEQEVFEALAHTFSDNDLKSLIKKATVNSPSGATVRSFDSEAFSDYSNGEYGGMYLDDEGTLVLCFVEDSVSFRKANAKSLETLRSSNSQVLFDSEGEIVVENYIIKAVEYSEQELLDAYELINDYAYKTGIVKSSDVDTFNNRIIVGVESKLDITTVLKDLNSIKSMLVFEFVEKDFMAQDIATITGTSAINNGSIQSTPAGKLYSSDLMQYGIVTCGHGWNKNDNVYYGSTKIGTVKYNKNNLTNDSSFILLNSGHAYQDTLNDEFDSAVPVVGSNLTLRGYKSGRVSGAKVLSTSSTVLSTSGLCTGLIKCDKEMQSGDSGGGAIGRVIDGGRTASIVAINKCIDDGVTYLIKGKVICNAY